MKRLLLAALVALPLTACQTTGAGKQIAAIALPVGCEYLRVRAMQLVEAEADLDKRQRLEVLRASVPAFCQAAAVAVAGALEK